VLWFAVEQYHWAPLWRSAYSRNTIIEIVRTRPDLPVLVKCLGHTAVSSTSEILTLRRDLDLASGGRRPAPCVVELEQEAWHGFLVYAEYGAANLCAVRAL
jgi:hypothetical protein